MDIHGWIIEWFEENTIAEKADLLQGINKNYFDCGWLDSMGFITFLTDLEEQFDVEFDNDVFQDRDFSTIAGLTRILEKLI